jgi:hypothetical protein
MQTEQADAIVFVCRAPAPEPDRIVAAIREVALAQRLPAAAVSANVSLDGADLYAYLWLREPTDLAPPAPLARSVAIASGAAAVDASRLVRLQDIRGASDGAPTAFHYVVETDVAPEAERDLNDWYDEEHLPGLAAVPGAIRARRLLSLDRAPRYHSCYDLVDKDTLGSPPWLAVRHTAWSDRVRPNFRNTKRTMFRRVAEEML